MYKYEETLHAEGYNYIAGCDEVGRGPLAGPLVTAAVILDPDYKIEGLNDSKQLTKNKRETLFEAIKAHAIAYQIKVITSTEVDRLNVYQASKKGMIEAVQALHPQPDYVLSDAMPLSIEIPSQSIIKGDTISASIAAASILAKVTRDHYMVMLSRTYPNYAFERHKGYPTKIHLEAIKKHGITPEHRKTFKPVKAIIEQQLVLDL